MASLPLFSSSPLHKCYAIRSISFSTRSHQSILSVEEELQHLKKWERSTSSALNAEAFCKGLTSLERLYTCVENLLNSHLTRQALSHYQHQKLVDELLVRSMNLLDTCGSIKDVVSPVKEHVRNIQSAQRRRKKDVTVDASFFMKLKKNAKKVITELKKMHHIYCSKLMNLDKHIALVITVVRDVSELSILLFGMILVFMSVFISKMKSTSKRSIVSKLILKGTSGNKHHQQICVEALDINVEGIENGLASVFRRLISTRASILNIKSN